MTTNIYTVFDIQAVEYNLEPCTCIFCGSKETIYIQYYAKDLSCQECGRYNLESLEYPERDDLNDLKNTVQRLDWHNRDLLNQGLLEFGIVIEEKIP